LTYAGIGSRKTPQDILENMTKIATWLESLGYTLNSGGAKGADEYFEKGVKTNNNI
jgi:predicted Rossmann fold nucleotide-binding protein DprA/Smf involved in DNA uptake